MSERRVEGSLRRDCSLRRSAIAQNDSIRQVGPILPGTISLYPSLYVGFRVFGLCS